MFRATDDGMVFLLVALECGDDLAVLVPLYYDRTERADLSQAPPTTDCTRIPTAKRRRGSPSLTWTLSRSSLTERQSKTGPQLRDYDCSRTWVNRYAGTSKAMP